MVNRNIHEIIKDWQQKNPQPTKKTEEYVHNAAKKWNKLMFEVTVDNKWKDTIILLRENLHKRDYIVLLIYYLLTVLYFWKDVGPDAFIVGLFIFVLLGAIFLCGAIYFSLWVEVCLCVYSLFLNKEKREKFEEKFSERWLEYFMVRTWLFLWGVVMSILTFSFIPKIFRFFKGKGGSFGGGGSSGRW